MVGDNLLYERWIQNSQLWKKIIPISFKQYPDQVDLYRLSQTEQDIPGDKKMQDIPGKTRNKNDQKTNY